MRWKTPEFSKTQIVKAGKNIKDYSSSDDEKKEAIVVIDNWRESHAYPLHVVYCNLKRNFNKSNYIVAQRLKRLDSIIKKLEREPTMSLWTMQDLGGCRLVVPSIEDVYTVIDKYKKSRIRHKVKKEYDYIINPKGTGYRSYHMVLQYQSDNKDTYNRNMLIEIQVRTHLQHLWATALETMGLFTNQALKANHGEKDVLRFFSLISSIFASLEKTPMVSGTPVVLSEVIEDVRLLEERNKYLGVLSAIKVAVDHLEEVKKQNGYYILILDFNKKRLKLKHYKTSQIEEATQHYNRIEKLRYENIDAVLVSVSSFSTLKAAYPNYFSDIGEFIKIVRAAIGI